MHMHASFVPPIAIEEHAPMSHYHLQIIQNSAIEDTALLPQVFICNNYANDAPGRQALPHSEPGNLFRANPRLTDLPPSFQLHAKTLLCTPLRRRSRRPINLVLQLPQLLNPLVTPPPPFPPGADFDSQATFGQRLSKPRKRR